MMSDFDMMDLPAKLVERLKAMGIAEPTPIQKQAIPHALNGRDVMGLAQTGTGKTAAFGVPLVAHMLENPKRPRRARCARWCWPPPVSWPSRSCKTSKGFVKTPP